MCSQTAGQRNVKFYGRTDGRTDVCKRYVVKLSGIQHSGELCRQLLYGGGCVVILSAGWLASRCVYLTHSAGWTRPPGPAPPPRANDVTMTSA